MATVLKIAAKKDSQYETIRITCEEEVSSDGKKRYISCAHLVAPDEEDKGNTTAEYRLDSGIKYRTHLCMFAF